jgi:TRAP-type C4-dicarboxylate transport system permease small subunit
MGETFVMDKKIKVLALLNKIGDGIEKSINFCACIFLVIIALSVIIQVLCRHINIPVVWLGELSVFGVIWTVFFGLAVGYRHGMLAQVDIICHLIPKKAHKVLGILWDLVCLVLMLVILVSSRSYIFHIWNRKMFSPELRWPLYLVYLGPVLGYVFTGYFTVVNILTALMLPVKPGEGKTGTQAPALSGVEGGV